MPGNDTCEDRANYVVEVPRVSASQGFIINPAQRLAIVVLRTAYIARSRRPTVQTVVVNFDTRLVISLIFVFVTRGECSRISRHSSRCRGKKEGGGNDNAATCEISPDTLALTPRYSNGGNSNGGNLDTGAI